MELSSLVYCVGRNIIITAKAGVHGARRRVQGWQDGQWRDNEDYFKSLCLCSPDKL